MTAPRPRSDRHPPGSYCLAVCLCGEHPDYRPTRPAITAATAPSPDTRQAASWADREDPTWLDR